MKASTSNKLNGGANIAKGNAKQVAGKALGKPLLQARGRGQEIAGKVQVEVGKRQKAKGK
jgi:uncharacterized protein YjbJ (UPF0337 family)